MGTFGGIFPETTDAEVRRYRRGAIKPAVQDETTAARIAEALKRSCGLLYSLQNQEGWWCGDLTADSTLESDYVLLQLWLHQPAPGPWNPPTRNRIDRACRTILDRQLADGGWNLYPGGPSDISATVKAYSALRIAGYAPSDPAMARARRRILDLGGIQCANSYTKINLSLFGLYPRKYVPSVPPEIVLLPGDILYEMSSWSRAILVPLSIVQTMGKQRTAPEGVTLEEIFHPDNKLTMPSRERLSVLFLHLDKVVKLWERRGLKDVRSAAIREAEHWILDRTRYTEGLGAIYPAMMYFIMALDSLGYAEDHPDLVDGIRVFDNLLIETEDRFQFQPCYSPIWDTAIAAFALGEAKAISQENLTRAADWLLAKEVRRKGDWSVKRPNLEPGGWAFEFANEYYPDIDDTAMVLLSFLYARGSDPQQQARARQRAINWIVGMQGSDGGWAAFDVDNNWQILNKIPFADHNAMLDPSCPDITGRVLEALARHGLSPWHPAIQGGVRYLLGAQESDGSWYGRWGVNYIYGTFLALRGLKYAKASAAAPIMQHAAQWIRSVQNADGGWGETCASYDVNHYVAGPSTASQTAWALLGLQATGDTSSAAVRRGVDWLLDRQLPNGDWAEELMTGTGFPRVFYLQYHLYRHYFPILALASV
ncbi:MAG TPA: squalene--hopene cyclase [Bryobacteraceae bacterium]|nr:squalene--hopene cyclase [Bryobacteraceae bacterium]